MKKVGPSGSPPPSPRTSGPSAPSQTAPSQTVARGSGTPPTGSWKPLSEAAQQSVMKMPSSSSTPLADDKKTELDLGKGEKFPITHFNTQVNGARFTQTTGPGPKDLRIDKQPLPSNVAKNPPEGNQKDGVYLGWKEGTGEVMDLAKAGDKKFFATAPLNGCALVIGGSPQGPTLMHANYAGDALMEGMGKMSPSQVHDHQLGVYQDAYKKISAQAFSGGHVPTQNAMVFDPSQYLQNGSGVSAVNVFGTKGDDGNWTLHYSAMKTTTQEPSFFGKLLGGKPTSQQTPITGELWPNPNLEALKAS